MEVNKEYKWIGEAKGEIGYVTKTEIRFVPSGYPSVNHEETQSVKEKKRKGKEKKRKEEKK